MKPPLVRGVSILGALLILTAAYATTGALSAGDKVLFKRTYQAGETTTYHVDMSVAAFNTGVKTTIRQTATPATGGNAAKVKFELLDYTVTGPADSAAKPVDFETKIGPQNAPATIPFQPTSSSAFLYVFLAAAQLTADSEVQAGDTITFHWKPGVESHSMLLDAKGTILAADQKTIHMKLDAPIVFDGQPLGTLTLDETFDTSNGKLRRRRRRIRRAGSLLRNKNIAA